MNPHNILLSPILSEKSTNLREKHSCFVFKVCSKASKTDIAKAMKAVFNVEPLSVQTSVVRGKMRRRGMHLYKKSNFKKAYISLPEGTKLSIFEH